MWELELGSGNNRDVNIASTGVTLSVNSTGQPRLQMIQLSGNALSASQEVQFPSTSGTDAVKYNSIHGMVDTDQSGTLNVQCSDDGVSFTTTDTLSVTGGTPAKYNYPLYGRYVRVDYVNGATAQTTFVLSAYLSQASAPNE